MFTKTNRQSGLVATWVVLLFLGGLGISAATAEKANSLGRSRSIADLSAAWWQWAYELPDEDHPLTTDGEVDCSLGQEGPVWFLAGTTGATVDRTCDVPHGRTLFFPLVNSAWVNVEGDCEEPDRCPVQVKRDILDFVFTPFPSGLVCNLFSSVDGVSTIQSSIVTARTQSGTFPVEAQNSVFLPEGSSDDEAVSDGYWINLPALSAGEHDIQFGGALCDSDTNEAFFEVDVTYHVTILEED
jgi:hypothetical protein